MPFDGDVYYAALIGATRKLVRTDGTGTGTAVVAPALDGVTMLAATSSHVLFAPVDDDAGGSRVLWRSDGTLAGTVRVQTLDDVFVEEPRTAVSSGGRVFFTASRSDSGALGLWVSDGTAAGTVELLADDALGSVSVLVPFGDGVAFAFDDGVHGLEPWVSDGTPTGTRVVEVVPGATGSSLGSINIATLNGWAYFNGSQAATGSELWRTDGTTTERVTDLTPGSGDGIYGSGLWAVGDRLFFPGIDVAHATEMWFVEDVPPAPAAPTSPVAVAGNGRATVSWTAPPTVPGAPVTAYAVTATPGGATCSTTGALSCTVTGLTPGTSYTFRVRATNRIGTSPASVASNAVVPTAPPPAMVPLVPARLLETRIGADLVTVDGQFQGVGRQAAGTVAQLTVTGRGGVPADASAVMLNVTAVFPDGPGYLTVFPCGETQPLASSVNYGAGSVVPNAVLAKVGATGAVCIYTLVGTDVIVDVNGYVPAGGSPSTVVPARVLETRSGSGLDTVDGLFEGGGRVAAGSVLELTVAGRGGVPDSADAVMLNVTAVFPDGPGYLTVFPCGETQPLASSVNYAAGQVVPNAVLAKVGADGAVCIYTLATTDVIVDVNGFVPGGASPATVVPARLLETRAGAGLDTVDGQFEGIGHQGAGTVLALTVTGRGGVPDDATAVMVNVTAVFPDGPGYLTVFPCGEAQPLASNVNYAAGQVVPNAVLAKVGSGGAGSDGRICVYTSSGTDLLVDVTGYL